jgi:UDP-N-acetylmuramyl pentapeptide phosphotransferase/UDP-N-acetylglucosamine-1-phosphate transferase
MFTISERYYQGDIAFASILLSAACLGFLILNWHPARIFLGEGGSIFLGYALGTLAIISGGKIAIAFLVMGLPILDLFWTVLRRVSLGKNPFRSADRKHLHHRLLDMGLSQRQTVAAYYFFALFFGLVSLFLQSRGKLLAIMVLFLIMFAVVVSLYFLERKKNANQ